MIIVRLNGGLGNQLFQYALGKALSILHQAPLKLDITWYKKGIRQYELKYFDINENIATEDDISATTRITQSWKNRLDRNLIQPLLPYYKKHIVEEKQFNFDPNILKVNSSAYLNGYWQNEKYFKSIEAQLRKDLRFKEPLDEQNRIYSNLISQKTAISLHVRRGDYVSNSEYQQIFGTCDIDYYKKAISWIADRVIDPHFFLFSDDIPWIIENLDIPFPFTIIDHNKGDKSYRDMQLMSLCKHHIIANSTFSWWGAWLNPSKEKKIIAPKKWTNVDHERSNYIIPANWHKI
ncbi:alpha-1,2-fucosyltransferase [Cytophagaceae bacterium DM2B3-1]|uniref:Alpha-1,2-fucosyltransferase n=1 Tax=Xanthocytophaga flava TaxID=3048013 RepID=A0ABT7CKN3_9BACT|nr:alpha-1,2-fucosyltransferase [Xanthocytophaga flavus]MDJ1469750.1 alpha-1,2-fucosyltransferase [Xanthocytophaga flavus]MDJ1494262.1 alpha-1,2-fucosyltransferase [Xanthocytophaga flavus]